MASILTGIQQNVADTLSADPFFADIPVLAENLRDMTYLATKAVDQIGLLVLVTTPAANQRYADMATPYFDEINLIIRVIEDVAVNRGQGDPGVPAAYVTAPEVAEVALAVVYHTCPAGVNEVWNPAEPTLVTKEEAGFVVSEVRFKTAGGIAYPINQVAAITGSFDGANVTLACSTPGAAIFWTNDKSYPAPQNGSGGPGNLYLAPFPAATGQLILAKALLAGMLASDVFSLQL